MKLEYIYQLKKNTLFKDYSINELKIFLEKYRDSYYKKTYTENSVIFFQNDLCENLNIILSGEVTIKRIDLSGNTLIMDTFTEGSDISANLLFSKHNTYPMTILANKLTTIIHFKKEFVIDICYKDKRFLENLLMSIGEKNYILTQKISLLSLENLREKIVFYLKQRYLKENSKNLKIINSKKDLAQKLNVTRPSLSRTLKTLKNEGLINYDNNTFYLLEKFPFDVF